MSLQLPKGYWDRKMIAYMHDPLDKVLKIQGHENRSGDLLATFGLGQPNERFWKLADGIASGFERGQVPSYSKDPNKNGAVDFLNEPVLTHPVSAGRSLKVVGLEGEKGDVGYVNKKLVDYLQGKVGMTPDSGGYSDAFKGDPEKFAKARFFYTHLALRFRLAEDDVAGLGALWHRLPADSRFPDHSIWQHNALCSALYSCMELGEEGSEKDLGLMVFSLAPVQDFIAKARKLKDFWSGSVILSWLAFEGIRWVMENLGPDHVLYPSLIDQPLISTYLATDEWKIEGEHAPDFWQAQSKDIASFPNKFLCVIPVHKAREIGDKIKEHINNAWRELKEQIYGYLLKKMGDELDKSGRDVLYQMFARQCENYWDLQWTCVNMLSRETRREMEDLLPKSAYEGQRGVFEQFAEIIEKKGFNYQNTGVGTLYGVSHNLAQSALAARKSRRAFSRPEEPGVKCHMCGEFEAAHDFEYNEGMPAQKYKKGIDDFWERLRNRFDSADFNENEKLCSVCLIKRLAAYTIKNKEKKHILYDVFSEYERYPSSTELALSDFYARWGITPTERERRKKMAQDLYLDADIDPDFSEGKKLEAHDRYYAILLMDGDKMGKLVSGANLASTWDSVMHPEIYARLAGDKSKNFDPVFRDAWAKILSKYKKRSLTPSIHAAISESLGDFAIYGVSPIVKKYAGSVIYAGGDDVCAVLPLENAFAAAREISDYYRSYFRLISNKGKDVESRDISPQEGINQWPLEKGKLSINLGAGDNLTLSAGILICHHKENLSHMIARAQNLLKYKAKEQGGRNACAVELRKRSGGSRYFMHKWDDAVWDDFIQLGKLIQQEEQSMRFSSSLVYRLESMRPGVEAILRTGNTKDKLTTFIRDQMERSEAGAGINKHELAEKTAGIVVGRDTQGNPEFSPEALIVAGFMAQAHGGEKNG